VARLALQECVVNLDGPSPEEIAEKARAEAAAAAGTDGEGEGEEGTQGTSPGNKPAESATEAAGARSAARLMADLKTVSGDLKVRNDVMMRTFVHLPTLKMFTIHTYIHRYIHTYIKIHTHNIHKHT
jgi:hypothetical protein